MRSDIKRRLAALEDVLSDHVARLPLIDYVGLEDYNSEDWQEVYRDPTVTVYCSKQTGEVRGVYCDRRSANEIRAAVGSLEFL